ncbi:peptide/nickel transport system permease protein [Nakamurella sp. UYEF19]|uniref:ABC transporter permease n=1 Tax=Nakamurella sp. UYEF19 TaxID=1756392 RepID=UPI003398A229
MRTLLGRWLLTAVPLVFCVTALTFVLTSLVPGDAARSILGISATPEQVSALNNQLGLDRSMPAQYGRWLLDAVRGDLGTSITSGVPVSQELAERIGVTLSLILGALVVATVIGVGLGVYSAVRGGWSARAVDVISLLGLAVPTFWLGLVLLTIFAVRWQVFPATGYTAFGDSPVQWFESLVLPVVTLGLAGSAPVAKQTRSGVLSELGRDYVPALRSRGITERSILLRHVLRNAGGPIVTVLGLMVIGLLGGTVLAETVFVMPGLGSLAVTATSSHDIPTIQGVALVFTIVVLLVNLAIEMLHAWLNPKVRS